MYQHWGWAHCACPWKRTIQTVLTGKKDEKSLTSHCPVVSTILTQPYLATKFYGAANPDIQAVFEEQLKRLQTDYFDFYLLHGMDENFISDYMDKDKD
ncbi:hypothetical protein DWY12_26755 [Enterocloster bolteae]|uniref:NADP-dependent oxidoreductase domain-containing protein n=1 Tax=Enterocloster bolteae TaxID=208479 RepID=A0A414AWY2_9FIRM|nr:hypothetical protein DXC96_01915 [Enterocloster bolteae]RGQ61431.1 hypothetical protein DWY91_10555 [Enterocloster bolteae]RGS03506.1 hypothetical protein DWY12_26755 [Enterocloster bolteae]RGV76741.1 hypothetical protein DWW02_09255 [Enterocloster bolteae]RHC56364.1 hypothetical protein DW839_10505 [Enterocloster bolteae]